MLKIRGISGESGLLGNNAILHSAALHTIAYGCAFPIKHSYLAATFSLSGKKTIAGVKDAVKRIGGIPRGVSARAHGVP